MGRQVNCYLTHADESELLESLRDSEVVIAYPLLAERRAQHISTAEMIKIVPRYGTRQYGLSLSRFSPENKRGHKPFFPLCFAISSRHGSQTPFVSRWPGVSCDESHLARRIKGVISLSFCFAS